MGNDIWDIYFYDINNGIIIGDAGSILRTTNGGKNWLFIESHTEYNLKKLSILNDNEIVVVGENGVILKSYDRGFHFQIINSPTNKNLFSVFFVDEYYGWACGEKGIIIHSTDKGENWTVQNEAVFGKFQSLGDIFFIDRNTGWTGGYIFPYFPTNGLLFTEDGGKTWKYLNYDFKHDIYTLYFFDMKNAFIGGQWYVGIMENGFMNIKENNFSNFRILDLFVMRESSIWLAVKEGLHGPGTIIKTDSKAEKWEKSLINTEVTPHCIYFIDNMNGWAAGKAGCIIKTSDGGKTWYTLSTENNLWFNDIFFCDEDNGYIIGIDIFMKTTDGGKNWFYNPLLNKEILYDYRKVFFVNKNLGWIICQDGSTTDEFKGRIFHTEDGGKNWQLQKIEKFKWPMDLYFINERTGFVIGNKIFKTTDGGNNWYSVYDSTGSSLFFINGDKGFAIVGNNLICTEDGGNTWSYKWNFGNNEIEDIYFYNKLKGWIATSSGIYSTDDGGETWYLQTGEDSYYINDIYFIDENNGWAVGGIGPKLNDGWCVGGCGLILRTTDSGNTWEKLPEITNKALKRISFPCLSHGFIIGNDGIMLEYSRKKISEKNIFPEEPQITFHNFPNPFNEKTLFVLKLGSEYYIEQFDIYNVLGQIIKSIISSKNRKKSIGYSYIEWNGKDDNGITVQSGVYLCKIKLRATGSGKVFKVVRKITVIK